MNEGFQQMFQALMGQAESSTIEVDELTQKEPDIQGQIADAIKGKGFGGIAEMNAQRNMFEKNKKGKIVGSGGGAYDPGFG